MRQRLCPDLPGGSSALNDYLGKSDREHFDRIDLRTLD